MQVELNKLIDDLSEKFWNNNTFSKPAPSARESVLQTIKAYFLKKDLVIVSRSEYEKLLAYKERSFLTDVNIGPQ